MAKHYFYTEKGELKIFDYWPNSREIPHNSYFYSDEGTNRYGYATWTIAWVSDNANQVPAEFRALLLVLL
jgi:hypothetical protein